MNQALPFLLLFAVAAAFECPAFHRHPTGDYRWHTAQGSQFTHDKSEWHCHADHHIHNHTICGYRIHWGHGNWSHWYKPGENDATHWNGDATTGRRHWSHFTDHHHEMRWCPHPDGSCPPPLPRDMRVSHCAPGQKFLGAYATMCGKVNLYRSADEWWKSDCGVGCDIKGVSYCKKFFPTTTSEVEVKVEPWQKKPFQQAGCTPGQFDWFTGHHEYDCCGPETEDPSNSASAGAEEPSNSRSRSHGDDHHGHHDHHSYKGHHHHHHDDHDSDDDHHDHHHGFHHRALSHHFFHCRWSWIFGALGFLAGLLTICCCHCICKPKRKNQPVAVGRVPLLLNELDQKALAKAQKEHVQKHWVPAPQVV